MSKHRKSLSSPVVAALPGDIRALIEAARQRAVVAPQGNGTFLVPPDLEQELDESLVQSMRGDTIAAAEVLHKLRTR